MALMKLVAVGHEIIEAVPVVKWQVIYRALASRGTLE
jgi:hypothetical protein